MSSYISFALVPLVGTRDAAAYLRLVPEISVVLAAAGIIFNLARDMYVTEQRKAGPVHVTAFVLDGVQSDTTRRLIPHFARLLLFVDFAIALVIVGQLFPVGVDFRLMNQPAGLDTDGIAKLVTLFNLLIVITSALITYRICSERHSLYSKKST